jgi:hypothetical protein
MMNTVAVRCVALLATLAAATAGTCPGETLRSDGSYGTDCLSCARSMDTSGWSSYQCEYCTTTGQCTASFTASCSGSWLNTQSECSGSGAGAGGGSGTASFLSRTGNVYCNGGYKVSGNGDCYSCSAPSKVGNDHAGATYCSVPRGNCCVRCPSGQTTSDSGRTAGTCVSIGSTGTAWYSNGHRRTESSTEEVSS